MAKTPSALIVDADIQARFETKQVVRASGLTMAGECGFGMEAASTASELQPDVILVGVAEPMERPIQTIESLQAFMPETPILVYSVTKELDTVRKAMMAGAKDFLARPIKPETLRNSVLAALLAEEKKRLRQIGQIPTSATAGTIVTVFGAKGGIGKSTVSANLAVAMAQMERASVCLVDLDDGFADLADMLDLKPERTLFDLVRDLDMIEREDISRYVSRHQFTSLDLMAGPSLLDWRKLHRDDVRRAIELLARNYDTVIIDTSGSLNELMEMAVEIATIVLWVTTTEYASVKDSIEAMRVLRKLSFSAERVRIVMNAVSPDDGVAPAVVQDALQRDVFWTVPYDRKVRQSTHLGQPAVITAPNSAAARSLVDLARAISGAGTDGDGNGRRTAVKWKSTRTNGNGAKP
jgi:pilus assembly protein CpaE